MRRSNNRKDEKAVSWFSENSDEVNVNGSDDEFTGASVGNQNKKKTRSLEVKQTTLTVDSIIVENGAADKIPLAMVAMNFNSHSMELLEGSLLMRRSETRVQKFNTRLIESVPGGDTAYMSRMLAMGANPNATCRLNYVSACHVAAMYNNDALELLLKSGAESSRVDKWGRTPLHVAAWSGNAKQIALLLDFPEDMRAKVLNVLSPEIEEQLKSHRTSAHQLINTPCELPSNLSTIPDAWSDAMEHNCRHMKQMLPQMHQGWTALHAASVRAQHHCVQLLLAAGANPRAQDILCRTPLDVAGCAYYIPGHKIEVANFKKTIRILLRAGCKLQNRTDRRINTPLHTAVELESEEAVEELLNGGASVTSLNSKGLTAMHVCVKKRNRELLQFLANYEYSNADPHVAIVDAKDVTGCTVLGAAVKEEWTQGVCIALGAGASITMKGNNGESPIHTAAELGNVDILQEILTVNFAIDFRNLKGETALFKAISHNKLGAVKILLSAGADITLLSLNRLNVIHIAAKHGNRDILNHLLEYNDNVTSKLINNFDTKGYTPLVYAVLQNHPECVNLLIKKGATVDCFVKRYDSIEKLNIISTTPLHVAASKNHCEIAKIIIAKDRNTINIVDSMGRLPLHEACCHGNREIIVLLLSKGADLSGAGHIGSSKTKFTPIDILMNNLSKPTEFMEEIFDSYISSQGKSLQESNCEVKVNYTILVPKESSNKQMSVIKALVNTGNRYDQNRLLLHPLVQSFLYLKWKTLLPFFYSILVLHICFVLSLNVYVLSVFYYMDKKKVVPCYLQSNVWKHIIILTVCLIAIQEIIFIKIRNKRYLLCLETWLKFWAIALAVVLPRVVSWERESSSEWPRFIATIALLFSWFEMMFLLSRFPDWGFYVLMFGKVANKVFKILLSFFFLIFGFSVSFMIQFRAQPPFEGPWAAFVETMVMMISEYDYQEMISKESATKLSASIIILRIIFLTFLILVSIVLMNLLVGVAVNDVNKLEIIGNIKRLEKQVEFIMSLEDIVCHKFIRKILPKKLYNRWYPNKKWKNIIILRPRAATCSYCNYLPSHIREAIFEQAQLQKKQSDEELGSKIFKMKLDEIHNSIVKERNGDPKRTECSINEIVKEIDKMRSDIEFIKHFIVTNRRRRISSTQ